MLSVPYRRFFFGLKTWVGALLALTAGASSAGNPHAAYYAADNDKILWFILITDLHIGTRGSQDANNLTWVVTAGKDVVNPEFIVATGDLTDSTAGNIFGYPNGPYQSEWNEYKAILAGRVDATNFYDIPGNHDAYSDQSFAYYRANSIQGRATGNTQMSWVRQFPFGKYHFLGVNTADNSGDPFSISWPWGDYAGLDTNELAYIQGELDLHSDADLTLVFGHHPVTDTGGSTDTWLYYGAETFIGLLDQYGASSYDYGHTHGYSEVLFTGDAYTGHMAGDGVAYLNVASLGKSSDNHFSVIAIDCNGLSTKTQAIASWPLVLITAPVNHDLGGVPNPQAYHVPVAPNNPIRALVFDSGTISQVRYRIDGAAPWHPMQPVAGNPRLWEATWDNSGMTGGTHTIQVEAAGSSVRSDTITVYVDPALSDADGDGIPDWWENLYGGTNLFAGGASDYDRDGATDSDEHVADTNPTNRASLLKLGVLSSQTPEFSIWWPSATSRFYSVFKSADLMEWWPLTNLYWGDASGTNIYHDPHATNRASFYRVEVHKP